MLGAAILVYNWLHKRSALGPVIMGVCRFLVYAIAALSAGGGGIAVVLGALGLLCHVVGLTYAAKQEAYNTFGAAWPLIVMTVPVGMGAWMADESMAWLFLAGYVGWGVFALRLLFRRQPGDVPKAVVNLIAAISLYDATLVASAGAYGLAVLAMAAFGATLVLQRVAPGT
ncbi:MAG: hypothetical protein UMU75_06975, partial [Halomonas sp.]|nr:hypothetical protein [Halomonas sp.]